MNTRVIIIEKERGAWRLKVKASNGLCMYQRRFPQHASALREALSLSTCTWEIIDDKFPTYEDSTVS
jgi:hypothetical protein